MSANVQNTDKAEKRAGVVKYLSFFRMKFISGLQYRAAAIAGIATQFAWGFMDILIYSAFARSDPSSLPMPMEALTSYIWMRQAFLGLFMAWYFDAELIDMISSGNVAYELCRPADIYGMWFAKTAATRTSRAVLRCFPILLVAFFLPHGFAMNPPASAAAGALFALSLILGFLCVISFGMLVYISTFYTVSSNGLRLILVNIVSFTSGELIPLPFFPDAARRVLELSPFAAMQSTPYMIWGGVMAGKEALFFIGLQLFWFAVMTVAGKLWMKRALVRVVVQGA
ncbi:MAG: ABC transporter permease [Eubacteriales bacterium]